MSLRIIIAGGGTGGHIFPAVAIAHAVQRLSPGAEVLFVGAEGRMEMEKVPQEGFKIIGLPIAGFNRSNLLKNLSLPFKMLRSAIMGRRILKEFRPQVVVGVGGYASFPVLNAAQGMSIPTLIQEQNSFAGKSNRILGRKAAKICVAYEGMEKAFPLQKIVLTGNPVRQKIAKLDVPKSEGLAWSRLKEGPKTVLVVGGSLGAKSINEAVDAGLEALLQENVQIIWQTGKPYYEQAKARTAGLESRVKIFDFVRDIEYVYAAADIVISRAGALAIAELCIIAKPVVFVPYPFAAEDHQTSNAMALVQHNAAQLVRDTDAKTELVPKIKALLNDEATQTIMQEALSRLAITDADTRIAREVIALSEYQTANSERRISQ